MFVSSFDIQYRYYTNQYRDPKLPFLYIYIYIYIYFQISLGKSTYFFSTMHCWKTSHHITSHLTCHVMSCHTTSSTVVQKMPRRHHPTDDARRSSWFNYGANRDVINSFQMIANIAQPTDRHSKQSKAKQRTTRNFHIKMDCDSIAAGKFKFLGGARSSWILAPVIVFVTSNNFLLHIINQSIIRARLDDGLMYTTTSIWHVQHASMQAVLVYTSLLYYNHYKRIHYHTTLHYTTLHHTTLHYTITLCY